MSTGHQLVCDCLNVEIHCRDLLVDDEDDDDGGLLLDQRHHKGNDWPGDSFFGHATGATLTLAGVTKVYDSLCWVRRAGHWLVSQCAVCGVDTHASRRLTDNSPIEYLVNRRLKRNASSLRTETAGYSPVFRLILPTAVDNGSLLTSQNQLQLRSTPELDTLRRSIQQTVHRYINEEQRAMEDRIRTFTEQEHARFAEFQLRVGRDEATLVRLIESIGDRVPEIIPGDEVGGHHAVQDALTKGGGPIEIQDQKKLRQSKTQLDELKTFTRNEEDDEDEAQRFQRRRKTRSQSISIGVFDIDFEEEEDDESGLQLHAFDSLSYSDDEEDVVIAMAVDRRGGNKPRPMPGRQRQRNLDQPKVAYSLPVAVPGWQNGGGGGGVRGGQANGAQGLKNNGKEQCDDEDEDLDLHDEEALAERFKQLARSVRNECPDDVFGDLPRRRLNTGDLIKSRPFN